MNSEQFNLLLSKLEKLQKEREKEEVLPQKAEGERGQSKSRRLQ